MSDINSKKQDLRVKKTHRGFKDSLFKLLRKQSFGKITVNDICEEALISRATFYTHFEDKFDLLKFSLSELRKELQENAKTEEEIIRNITEHFFDNPKVYKNLLLNEGSLELMEMLNFLLVGNLTEKFNKKSNLKDTPVEIVVNFFAGGITHLLIWMLKNNFPVEKETMIQHMLKLQKITN